jgi:hypothetical protein
MSCAKAHCAQTVLHRIAPNAAIFPTLIANLLRYKNNIPLPI